MIRLFDSHCHLQDSRVLNVAPRLIKEALHTSVAHFAVNGVCEKDWHLVKEMSDKYPSVVPNFGLHPWFISDRTPDWLKTLKDFLAATPSAAVGEIGLDKGSKGKQLYFTDRAEVFRQQLQLAKKLKKPTSIHCVRAFADLLEILKSMGSFPFGLVLNSYLGSAEMVPELSKLGTYFSFSGFLMSMKESKAKKMLKSVPRERILSETDAPDALPPKEFIGDGNNLTSNDTSTSNDRSNDEGEVSAPENINHPANIHHVLAYVARLLEMYEKELAELSYTNVVRLFSYEGSKLVQQML